MFETYKDSAGDWRWRYRADNGRIMADSAEGYATKGNARRALRRFIALMAPVGVA